MAFVLLFEQVRKRSELRTGIHVMYEDDHSVLGMVNFRHQKTENNRLKGWRIQIQRDKISAEDGLENIRTKIFYNQMFSA